MERKEVMNRLKAFVKKLICANDGSLEIKIVQMINLLKEGKKINILQRMDHLKVDQEIKIRQMMNLKYVLSMQMKDHKRARQELKCVQNKDEKIASKTYMCIVYLF